ncbi:hypothetical protein [Lysinibacillus xylanilyticus]|uniref:hypothetical protein n=1 Tax=Lysinibacillus xylanilyticus TaxID=582475 RepID=UPI003CFFE7A4
MMYDSRYYQNKRKSEKAVLPKKKKEKMSEDTFSVIILTVGIAAIIVFLFVAQWNALQDGRHECESKGGVWHSSSTGKITITRCDGID